MAKATKRAATKQPATKQATTKQATTKQATTKQATTKQATTKQAAKASRTTEPARAKHEGPFTLAIDIGGSGLKASVLDARGEMTTERVRVPTPHPCTPTLLVDELGMLGEQLQALGQRWNRISVGFPGLIRHGVVVTAPNLDTAAFAGFDLKKALQNKLGAPCRAVNDADMQGLAVVRGKGVEMVCTLGTGFGTALFMDGRLQVHLEIAHLPFRKGETYDQQLGDRARRAVGRRKWLSRVHEALRNMHTLTNFDALYVGGGNARLLDVSDLPANTTVVDNSAGILGGIRLWDDLQADV
jgi:polyphosphate glucokinase